MVSVIIPVRDGERTIEQSICSVLDQGYRDLEVVVVDDGSQDDTAMAALRSRDGRVRLVRQEPSGVSAARNAGARASVGRLVVFLDCDDIARPNWLTELVSPVQTGSAAVACCAAEIRDPSLGTTTVRRPEQQRDGWAALFLAGCYLTERSLFLEVGGFDEQLRFSENFELGLRLQDACRTAGLRIAWTDEPLLIVDRSSSGTSTPWKLAAIERILAIHGEELRSSRSRHAKWLGMAAVEAARHDRRWTAMRYAARSLAAQPVSARAWARLALSAAPRLGRRRRAAQYARGRDDRPDDVDASTSL